MVNDSTHRKSFRERLDVVGVIEEGVNVDPTWFVTNQSHEKSTRLTGSHFAREFSVSEEGCWRIVNSNDMSIN